MAAATKRTFSDYDKEGLLKELGVWRGKCILVCTKAPIGSNVYKLAEKLIGDIDTAVETLTGDRKHFYTKPHSTK
ncbi:hypothetical protein [Mucilaginibacter ginsenosidivorax]|uniref:Uncharacterized protein n=1 Tax=Mucilaginibacter ginsenosidivorax TaxID=862126 RepID=A0A5B8W8P3_9SPHI|nr:hypothetical protein [Mucilaginibacter ginsenosidivorax]QEC79336.1 hypothetical protein FSB76_26555 [Mucilaginibacter ginsenosidivorax]